MNSMTSAATATAIDEGKPVSPSELEQALLFLEQTRSGIIGAIRHLSEAQWQHKPAPNRWSIAENLEHIISVQERVLGPIREHLQAASPPPPEYDYQRVDAIIINQFPNRLAKFPAPEPVHPTGSLTRAEARERLIRNYARLAKYLESTPDLRQHAIEGGPLKAVSKGAYQLMDGYHWILAAAAHTERHTKQVLELIAETEFPEA